MKDPSITYTHDKPDIEKIVFEELPFKEVVNGEWNKENSKGTYRILTDSFQVYYLINNLY